ncbi:MAG: hypothetical protein MRY32_06195 [Rickettsiales bacterium]|nr:hypothetical protein [Rickettsiales bacterium]
MLQRLAYSFVIGSCLMHLFCCGLPLLMSITSLAALVGITSGDLLGLSWFSHYSHEIMAFSGVVLVASIAVHIISSRINCRTDGDCVHEPCDEKKDYSRHLLVMATVLFVVNQLLFHS